MTVKISGTSITFNDGTVQTTAAGAPTTTQVLNATAGASALGVGTYAWLGTSIGVSAPPGTNFAGSNLVVVGFVYNPGNNVITPTGGYGSPSGTWKSMCSAVANGSQQSLILALRVS